MPEITVEESRRFTANIVSAYLGHHSIGTAEIPNLISSVHRTLVGLGTPVEQPEDRTPYVSIRRSVQPDHIVCLDCGWRGKIIKRHINAIHGLSPDAYRARWNLQSDYPMTARNYSETRSVLAKNLGLGRGGNRRRQTAALPPPVAEPTPEPVAAAAPAAKPAARKKPASRKPKAGAAKAKAPAKVRAKKAAPARARTTRAPAKPRTRKAKSPSVEKGAAVEKIDAAEKGATA